MQAGWSYPGFKLGWGFWYKAHRCLQFIQVFFKVKLLLCYCDLFAVTSENFNSFGPVIIILLSCCTKVWLSEIIHLYTSLAFREAWIILGFISNSTLEIHKRSQELIVEYKSSIKKSGRKTELNSISGGWQAFITEHFDLNCDGRRPDEGCLLYKIFTHSSPTLGLFSAFIHHINKEKLRWRSRPFCKVYVRLLVFPVEEGAERASVG